MAPRSVVDPGFVHGQDVGRPEQRVRGVHREGLVVKPPGSARHDGKVMGRGPLPQPRGDRRAIGADEHLAHAKLEHRLKELDRLPGLGSGHEGVVEPRRCDAPQALRPGGGIHGREDVARVVQTCSKRPAHTSYERWTIGIRSTARLPIDFHSSRVAYDRGRRGGPGEPAPAAQPSKGQIAKVHATSGRSGSQRRRARRTAGSCQRPQTVRRARSW